MTVITRFLQVFWNALATPPLAPCCASAVHWANFR